MYLPGQDTGGAIPRAARGAGGPVAGGTAAMHRLGSLRHGFKSREYKFFYNKTIILQKATNCLNFDTGHLFVP
jgi:hypothetical protein